MDKTGQRISYETCPLAAKWSESWAELLMCAYLATARNVNIEKVNPNLTQHESSRMIYDTVTSACRTSSPKSSHT